MSLEKKFSILIVDDVPDNIDVLGGILENDYKIYAATNGIKALEIAQGQNPDMILLDVMMPGMSGFEVCEKLKAKDQTSHIPIIFVTASDSHIDEERGFECGGVDYITKPVSPPIVKARVKSHLQLYNQQQILEREVTKRTLELQDLNEHLEKRISNAIEEIRQKDYVILEKTRQAVSAELLSLIAHHWRQPLNAIGLNIQSIGEAYEFDELDGELLENKISSAMDYLNKLSRSIDDFRFIYQEADSQDRLDVKSSLEKLMALTREKFLDYNIDLKINLEKCQPVTGKTSDFSQAVYNILENAIEIFVRRKVQRPVLEISCQRIDRSIAVNITDNGGGIDPEIRPKIFELYTSSKEGLNNTGTGLYLTRLIVEKKFRGKVDVIDNPSGTSFVLNFPII